MLITLKKKLESNVFCDDVFSAKGPETKSILHADYFQEYYSTTIQLRLYLRPEHFPAPTDEHFLIDFQSQALEIKLVPQAKNPQIFRLEAPVKVEGEFANVGFNLKGGFLGSAARMVVTTIATPFKKMFGDDIPEDGSDLCADPMTRDPR